MQVTATCWRRPVPTQPSATLFSALKGREKISGPENGAAIPTLVASTVATQTLAAEAAAEPENKTVPVTASPTEKKKCPLSEG